MDRTIEKKYWNRKKLLIIIGALFVTSLVLLLINTLKQKPSLNVSAERITISQVKKGTFQEMIPLNGTVLPQTTIYLDAMEGGRVEEKYVEDGATLTKGQPILRLSNTDLELSLANQETQVYNVMTQMNISRINATQNTTGKLNQMAEVENALKEAKREYELNKSLYDQRAIGKQEFLKTENNYQYQLQRKKLSEDILNQDKTSIGVMSGQDKQSLSRMTHTLDLMRQKVGDLVVRSPIDGQLTSLDAEIGQNKNKGERLGQIDGTSGFKVRVEVDEHYISKVFTGQMANTEINGKVYKLSVSKVFTQVTSGRFQVEMHFKDSLPTVRRGQGLQIKLALSDATTALLLPKGSFYQQTGGSRVFKLSTDGKTAYRVDVQLGRQNPEYYEVMNGLEVGDKIITSSYESYEKIQEIILNK